MNGLGKTQGPVVSELSTMRCLLISSDGGGEKGHKRLQHAYPKDLIPQFEALGVNVNYLLKDCFLFLLRLCQASL